MGDTPWCRRRASLAVGFECERAGGREQAGRDEPRDEFITPFESAHPLIETRTTPRRSGDVPVFR
jgi:hypothetical protein